MHKGKKETMEARLLKPSMSGKTLQHEETWWRTSSKKLDLDAPLLSVRRNRAAPPPERQEAQLAGRGHRSTTSTGSSFGRRPLVPFFTWEQSQLSQAIVPVETSRSTDEKDLVLRPPPVQQLPVSKDTRRRSTRRNVDSSDLRSEVARTEAPSLAPTYVVSQVNGGDDEDDEDCVPEYNAADREMILQRFLPAAKEVAKEMSSRHNEQQGEGWRQLTMHPSPQVHYRRKEETPPPPPKKSFGELINMHQEEDSFEEEEEEEEDEDDKGVSSTSCQVVGDAVCGFFPLLRMIQASSSSTSNCCISRAKLKKSVKIPGAQRKAKSTMRKKMESPKAQADEEEQFWSDQGGEEETEQPQLYMACRYTPSRGGLKSPAVVESKGFLGMPRDRAAITYIKRMYPVFETSKTHDNLDCGSVSSDSLSSIKLDKPSGGNSRQSSSGGMEKVFCLDTLNQIREGGGGAGSYSITPRKSNGEETYVSVVDERGNPNAVDEKLYYSTTKRKTRRKEEVMEQGGGTMISSGNKDGKVDEEGKVEEEVDNRLLSELRICWHEDDTKVLLPTPRGPAQSWLKQQQKKKLAQASRKPPLATKVLKFK